MRDMVNALACCRRQGTAGEGEGLLSFVLTVTWQMVGARPAFPLSEPQGRLTCGNRIRSSVVRPSDYIDLILAWNCNTPPKQTREHKTWLLVCEGGVNSLIRGRGSAPTSRVSTIMLARQGAVQAGFDF